MGAYINKAELLKELSVIQDRPVSTAMKIIKELSTIDLVKCKDCKWCEKSGGILWCNIWHDDTNGLNYCSYAERRADET